MESLKEMIVNRFWSLFPLHTSNCHDPVTEYCSLANVDIKKAKDSIANTLNNTFLRLKGIKRRKVEK